MPEQTSPPELAKTYAPADHEPRQWQRWLDARAFHADPTRVLSGGAEPYCVLIPPPNVTAALHLGHALNNTIQDVLVRARRMMGYETLWMPGTDHAGIATQTVVDRKLKEAGKPGLAEHKRMEAAGQGGRDAFVGQVQAWKDEFEARITDQLRKMGCSCDYDRQRFTMDEICARAVREGFFRLFKDGLIYRGKRLVNWDPVTQTALADDEVETHEVDGHFYSMRYPLVHVSAPGDHRPVTWGELATKGFPGAESHGDDDEAWITIATTRPETYLGDTGVAVNPKDPRANAVRGLHVELPLVGRVIPIVEDDYVVLPVAYGGEKGDPKAEFATGFLKVTPAHDMNDWEIGQRHGLEAINVMAPDASISAEHGWHDFDPRSGASVFIGKTREEARALVVREFQAHTLNDNHPLLEKIRDYRHSVGHSYRSHAAVEYYLSDQWYCRVTDDRLRGAAQRALKPEQRTDASLNGWPESQAQGTSGGAGDASMTFFPARYAKNYETWHDNLRDWCISRQLWWGHRIPVWSRGARDAPFTLEGAVSRTEGDTEFLCLPADDNSLVAQAEAAGFVQDADVLDTWFSSALWPLSTLGWPRGDLPMVHPKQIDQGDASDVIAVWVKRVGTFSRFIGDPADGSAELIEKLLKLRDQHTKTGGRRPLAYQLFSEADLTRDGAQAIPLLKPDDIQECDDLLCAVAVKERDDAAFADGSEINLKHFLLKHGFQSTAGLLDAFNPTGVLCTAREIITLWVSRMVMFNRYFTGSDGAADGRVPFRDVFIHAMIQ
ncbi:MAG: class I tRNA ligase family protein, partial [Planctomycetota bacterium]